jgi:aspartate aminotransferase
MPRTVLYNTDDVKIATEQPTIRFAERVTSMEASPTLAISARAQELARAGVDVVDFAPGEPDFDTPAFIADAAKRAIDQGHTRYTAAAGSPELRKAIAESYNRRYACVLKPSNVIAGTGGKQELFNLMLALVSEGDEVIIPVPYWVSFPDQVAFAGGRPVYARTDASNRFRPTVEIIERALSPRTRGVIINSPCNPSGAVIAEEELGKIVELCHSRGLFLIFDETYEFFVYDGQSHISAARWFADYPETVIVVNSVSKTFAMTGWRLGYAIAHPEIVGAAAKIQSHSTSNPCSISQYAAIEALQSDGREVRRMLEAYMERRSWMVPALAAIPGIDCEAPDGAFYIFPSVKGLFGRGGIANSLDVAEYLLDEARVAVVPGSAFGDDDYVRISYATSMELLREGVRRIDRAVRALG